MSHSLSGSSSSSSSSSSFSDNDDYEIIGVRQPLRQTPPARRAHAINVHERLELRQLTVEADDYLSICHLLNMLSILTLTLIAQLRSSASLTVLVKTYRGIIAFLAVCETELDVLTEAYVMIVEGPEQLVDDTLTIGLDVPKHSSITSTLKKGSYFTSIVCFSNSSA